MSVRAGQQRKGKAPPAVCHMSGDQLKTVRRSASGVASSWPSHFPEAPRTAGLPTGCASLEAPRPATWTPFSGSRIPAVEGAVARRADKAAPPPYSALPRSRLSGGGGELLISSLLALSHSQLIFINSLRICSHPLLKQDLRKHAIEPGMPLNL